MKRMRNRFLASAAAATIVLSSLPPQAPQTYMRTDLEAGIPLQICAEAADTVETDLPAVTAVSSVAEKTTTSAAATTVSSVAEKTTTSAAVTTVSFVAEKTTMSAAATTVSSVAEKNTTSAAATTVSVSEPGTTAAVIPSDQIVTGSWGDNITYTLDKSTGKLTVSGTGEMKKSSTYYSEMPFYSYKDIIKTAVFEEGITALCNYALLSCAELTSVTLPSTLTRIGYSALEGCEKLSAVKLPAAVTVIEKSAFEDCSALETVSLSASLLEIGDSAFRGCKALQSLQFPKTLEQIGAQAFSSCAGLTAIALPDSLKSIGSSAFSGCANAVSLTLSAKMTEIPESAFSGCEALKSVTIPGNILTVSSNAFQDCAAMEKAVVQEGVTALGNQAFSSCTALAEVSLPDSLTQIGTNVFEGTAYEGQLTGDFVILDNGTLYQYNGTDTVITLPGHITSIASGVFRGKSITEVTVPDGITSISGVFAGCKELQTVHLPSTLTEIGSEAFKDCTALTTIEIPEQVKTIGDNAFAGCSALADVTIPADLEIVGEDAFLDTPFLQKQSDDLVIFGKALYYCNSKATEITVPEGVLSISPSAFVFDMDLEKVTFPSTLTTIGENAFLGCHALKYVILPESVTEIGSRAVGYYCNNGTSGFYEKQSAMVVYGTADSAAQKYCEENEIPFYTVPTGKSKCGESLTWSLDLEKGTLTVSGTGAMTDYDSYSSWSSEERKISPFYPYRSFIRKVVLEEGVTSVGAYAFSDCAALTEVSLPATLTTIGKGTFKNCTALGSITFQKGLTEIQYHAFYNTALSSVVLPDNLQTLGSSCFGSCNSLRTINIPAQVTEFSADVVSGSAQLEAVNVSESNEKYASTDGVVYNKEKTSLVLYPAGRQAAFFELPASLTTLNALSSPFLKTVMIPESVKRLNDSVFNSCKNLSRVIFLGSAPKSSRSSLEYPNLTFSSSVMVSCSFSAEGWKELMAAATDTEHITWDDLDALAAQNSLKITGASETMEEGSTVMLYPALNPILAVDFQWESSNPKVLTVSENGFVTALKPGTATISCTSADGEYYAWTDITVTEKSKTETDPGKATFETVELSKDMVGAPYLSMQFPCEGLQGIYFLNDTTLYFYSLVTHTAQQVFQFEGGSTAYGANGMIYMASQKTVQVYDMEKQCLHRSFHVPAGFTATAVGADASGRIYVSAYESSNNVNNRIFLFTAEGELISQTSFPTKVFCFDGFDASNGRFYVESSYDYYSWGYHHPGNALNVGIVDKNGQIYSTRVSSGFLEQGIISRSFDCLSYLCQDVHFHHQNGAAMCGDRYLVYVSSMTNTLTVSDSDAEALDSLMSIQREVGADFGENSMYTDTTAVGTRAVYLDAHDSLVIYENGKILKEYDPKTQKLISTSSTAHYVYNLLNWNDSVFAVEKDADGNYYLEYIDWSDPETITIKPASDQMKVGETQQISLENGKDRETFYQWSSSDDSILTISESGIATAWKSGTVTISCDTGSIHAECVITVTDSARPKLKTVTSAAGLLTNNQSLNNYLTYDSVINSYLFESADGLVTRVEYLGKDEGVLIEDYDKSTYALKNSLTVDAELGLFGGFYAGSDYNYLVFGQTNSKEDDSAEVMRIVRYTKDWKRTDACSIYGANTVIPFDAGTLRMSENAGKLYIHTCHEMYADENGINHQANMIFEIDMESMKCEQSYYDVFNISRGYVSHSFSQFIQNDGAFLYRVDHGDANPRAISLTKTPIGGMITDVTRAVEAYPIAGGYGNNTTGVSVGGFELSDDNCLIAFNSIDMNAENASKGRIRNIYLYQTDKKLSKSSLSQLTEYDENSNVTVKTPQLVKLTTDSFLLMWEETNSETSKTVTKLVTLNGDGKLTSEIKTANIRLSDCHPVLNSDGIVRWYVTNGTKLYFYSIDPFRLNTIQGNDVSWSFEEKTGTLTISGSGDMEDYESGGAAPWASHIRSIQNIVIDEGVTSIGTNAFAGASVLKSVTIPETVTSIGENALIDCLRLTRVRVPKSVTEIQPRALGFVSAGTVLNDFTIEGEPESTAQTYADANKIAFSDKKLQKGDVDQDGEVNLKDVTLIKRWLCGGWKIVLDKDAADVNSDGSIDQKDVVILRRYLAGGWNIKL